MKEDKKYVWWGLLGIGVAAFFYFLSSKNKTQAIQVPYLVPQTVPSNSSGVSQTDTSLNEQPSIIGSHPNSSIDNRSIPFHLPVNNSSDWTSGQNLTPNPGSMINPSTFLTSSQVNGTQPIASNPNFGIPWATYYNPQTGGTYQVT